MEASRGLGWLGTALLALACADSATIAADAASPGEADRPAAPVDAGARREVRAPVTGVAIRIAESHPREVFADVTSGLPNGCAQYARATVRREGETIFIDVFNSEPAGQRIACTMIYGEKATAHALGRDFRSGVRYTVVANDLRETFVAP